MKLFCYFEAQTTIYFDPRNLISFTYPCSVQSPLIFNLVVKAKEIYIDAICLMCTVNYSCTMHNIYIFFTILNGENKFVHNARLVSFVYPIFDHFDNKCGDNMNVNNDNFECKAIKIRLHCQVQSVGSGTRHVSYLFGHENRLQVKLEGKPDKIGGTYG